MKGPIISKEDLAANEKPKTIKREDFESSAEWGKALMDFLLKKWEDTHIRLDMILRARVGQGLTEKSVALQIIGKWKNFRKLALKIAKSPDKATEFTSYSVTEDIWKRALPDQDNGEHGMHQRFERDLFLPFFMLSWEYGRRIYELDQNSVDLLTNTDLSGKKWEDVQFPFRTFLITLPKAIPCKTEQEGVFNVEAVLVNKIPKPESEGFEIIFSLITSNPDKTQFNDELSDSQRRILLDVGKNKKSEARALGLLLKIGESIKGWAIQTQSFGNESEDYIDDEKNEVFKQLVRIVAGSCMYLNSRTNKGSLTPGRPSVEPVDTQNLKTINDEGEIFKINVTGEYPNPESFYTGVISGIPRKSPEPHARASHTRQIVSWADGEIKDIEIAETIVNRHKLAEGETHGGKTVKVSLNKKTLF